jgi:trk system potassium uptake protein TrkH
MTIARTICLGFFTVIMVGTILLIMPFSTTDGSWGNLIVALFTSTSAVCVTGLIVVDTGQYFSFWGELIITLLIQVGGLGYMTTTTFLLYLLGRKFDFRHKLAIQESFDRPFLQGSRSLIRSIIATTLIFEITGILFLMIVFSQEFGPIQGFWLSLFHSISAWNNAGFSLFEKNLMDYHSSIIVNLVITLLIICGGIGYQVIIEIYFWVRSYVTKDRYSFSLNFKVVTSTTIFLLLFGFILFFLVEFYNSQTLLDFSLKDKLLAAWFQSVTTRTAGFNSIDNGKMTIAGIFLTMGLMFVGASPSGTGGGIKTTTFNILYNCTRSVLRGNENVIVFQREVPNSLILKAIAVLFGSGVLVISITFIISLIEFKFNPSFVIIGDNNLNFVQILFEVISAFATVGLSTGITASLSWLSQLLLVLTMYTGRVGILILMSAVLGDPRPSVIQYPEENLLVG